MVVSERNISDALAYLADDPHPIAVARKRLTEAENYCKALYASAFLHAEGSVEARKAIAETDVDHQNAKAVEAEAPFDIERHKARIKAAEMILEIWRTENANARAAERVR